MAANTNVRMSLDSDNQEEINSTTVMGEATLREHKLSSLSDLFGFAIRTDFVNTLIRCVEFQPRDKCIEWLNQLPTENTISKKILYYMLAEDDPNCIRAIIEALNTRATPMHNVAFVGANQLAQILLHYGLDPNVRLDFKVDRTFMKQVLPLDVALDRFRFDWGGSVFKLIFKMCTRDKRHFLETARVLALHTKELDQEIFKYTKEGKVVHLCALMLLGYYSRIPSVDCFEGDEITKDQMLQLVEIFQKIGDKLQVYITIPRALSVKAGRVVMDISSLFKDAGFTVKYTDTIMYRSRKIFGRKNNGAVGEDNRSLRVDNRAPLSNSHVLQDFNGNDMAHNVTLGSRSLHTSSITKVHKDVALSFPWKGYVASKSSFWKNSSFWMMALRRAVRHI